MALVLGCHPRLGGLLDQLLADRVHTGVERLHGAGALGARLSLLTELGHNSSNVFTGFSLAT